LDKNEDGVLDIGEIRAALARAGIDLGSVPRGDFTASLASSRSYPSPTVAGLLEGSLYVTFPEFRDYLPRLPRRATIPGIFRFYQVRKIFGPFIEGGVFEELGRGWGRAKRLPAVVNFDGDVSLSGEEKMKGSPSTASSATRTGPSGSGAASLRRPTRHQQLSQYFPNGDAPPGALSGDASGQVVEMTSAADGDDNSQTPQCQNTIFIGGAAVNGAFNTGWTQLPGFELKRDITVADGGIVQPDYELSGRTASQVKRLIFVHPGLPRDSWQYINLVRDALICAAANASNNIKLSKIVIAGPVGSTLTMLALVLPRTTTSSSARAHGTLARSPADPAKPASPRTRPWTRSSRTCLQDIQIKFGTPVTRLAPPLCSAMPL